MYSRFFIVFICCSQGLLPLSSYPEQFKAVQTFAGSVTDKAAALFDLFADFPRLRSFVKLAKTLLDCSCRHVCGQARCCRVVPPPDRHFLSRMSLHRAEFFGRIPISRVAELAAGGPPEEEACSAPAPSPAAEARANAHINTFQALAAQCRARATAIARDPSDPSAAA